LEKNELLTELNSFVGRLLRDHFGKGPESVYVSMNTHTITFHLRGFLSPMEKILMNQDQEMTIQETRDLLMQSLIPEIIAYIKVVAGFTIGEFYYDWSLQNRSGVFVGFSNDSDKHLNQSENSFENKEKIHHQIAVISKQAQKVPNEIYSYYMNPRTLIVIREGILVSIEKELIRLGKAETLRLAKRNLEKRLLHNNTSLEELLDGTIVDSFVDWDFSHDKSVITFITRPNERGGSEGLDH
jgi:uncharacterized protein YbcI